MRAPATIARPSGPALPTLTHGPPRADDQTADHGGSGGGPRGSIDQPRLSTPEPRLATTWSPRRSGWDERHWLREGTIPATAWFGGAGPVVAPTKEGWT